jgi:hypothetical protein
VILQKRRPCLSTTAGADRAHVFLDCAFADLDTQFEQFPTDAFGSPLPTSAGHVANEVDGLLRQRRVASMSRASPPKQAEAGSVPAEDSVWLHDGNGPAPCGEQRGAQKELQPIS